MNNIGKLSIRLSDITSGVTVAIAAIPDALANAVIATVNPIHGLYAAMVAPMAGSYWTSSFWMNINSTTALALVAGDVLVTIDDPEQKIGMLVIITLLAGAIQLFLGALKLGKLTRFISNAVMTGFMTGVAVLIFLSQLNDFFGIEVDAKNKVMQAVLVAGNFSKINWATAFLGVTALGAILFLKRTRIRNYSLLGGIAVPTLIVTLGMAMIPDVFRGVATLGEVPKGLPIPRLPAISGIQTITEVIPAAIAVAFTGLVQGAGISESFPNPDGKYSSSSKDLMAQGGSNAITAIFTGLPVGGSMSSTAIMASSRPKSRMAHVFSGLAVFFIIALFSGMIANIPRVALSSLLLVAAVNSIKPARIKTIWNTGRLATAAMVVTFAGTMVLSLPIAVLLGAGLSLGIFLFRKSEQASLVELRFQAEKGFIETPSPKDLKNGKTTILLPYGSLFFAAARSLAPKLPAPGKARHAVVIIVLRGRQDLGSTFIEIIQKYVGELAKNECRLILAGVSKEVEKQLERTGLANRLGDNGVVRATPNIGEALFTAIREADLWIKQKQGSV